MNDFGFNEKINMYYQTTKLAITVFNSMNDIVGVAGEMSSFNKILDGFPTYEKFKTKLQTNNYYRYKTSDNKYFLSILIKNTLLNDLVAVIGPYYFQERNSVANSEFSINNDNSLFLTRLQHITHVSELQHINYLNMLFQATSLRETNTPEIIATKENIDNILMEYRKIDFYHHNYLDEYQYIHHRFKGRMTQNDINYFETFDLAITSEEYLRSVKNIVIVNIAVMGRYAIEKGVDSHLAFSVGDVYIRKLEKLHKLSDILLLMNNVYVKYKSLVDKLKYQHYSKKVRSAIQYIDRNLSLNFNLKDVAVFVNTHPNYLSSLFKKETGMSFTSYILFEKIEEAKILLKYSNDSLSEISGILNFSSISYFIKCFKRTVGITPTEYTRQN